MHNDRSDDDPRVEVLPPREVPLGGPRSMSVRRSLPQRHRPLIGAWCFLDHYGPDDVADTGGMHVPPHPHAGLQTVTWLFAGEVEHRDSGGARGTIGPGELGLMTAGHGICHSEVSTPPTTVLHGVQLWIALPDSARETERAFHHYVPRTVGMEGAAVTVFVGSLLGVSSPVTTYTPLLGAEIALGPHVSLDLGVDRGFEHGILVDTGEVTVDDEQLARHDLGYVAAGAERLSLVNHGDIDARLILLGGVPFDEPIVMWWNFVGRSHDEIERMRTQWQAGADRFGAIDEARGDPDRLDAPTLPHVQLRPRSNPRPQTSIEAPTASRE